MGLANSHRFVALERLPTDLQRHFTVLRELDADNKGLIRDAASWTSRFS